MMSEPFKNALKVSIACLIGLLVVHLVGFESKQWVIITIVVVMSTQASIGGALQKSYFRLLGTIAGSLVAILTLVFFKEDVVVMSSVVIVCIFLFCYLPAWLPGTGQAWVMGSASVALILLSSTATLHYALLRVEEILSGIVIALLVNVLVLPVSATKKLRKMLADNLITFESYYRAIIDEDSDKCEILERKISESFVLSRSYFSEAKMELHMDKSYYLNIFLHERRLFRAIHILEHYLHKTPQEKESIQQECFLVPEMLLYLNKKILGDKRKPAILDQDKIDDLESEKKGFFAHFIFQEIRFLLKFIQ